MLDKYNRRINYLRISVTDRCNLRCIYCMPEEGIKTLNHEEILNFSEILDVVQLVVKQGVDKIRITGGEPLVRRGIVELIKQIADVEGVVDLAMTTNAVLLPKFAKPLYDAGLKRINVSLDTIDALQFSKITRGGNIAETLTGIKVAQEVGFKPIKINCVIQQNSNEPDARAVTKYCEDNNLQIRYIRQMDLEKGLFWQVDGGEGGNCKSCNRLRLTSNGLLKPCLFSDLEYNIRELGVEQALELALTNKPYCGTNSHRNYFSGIGG